MDPLLTLTGTDITLMTAYIGATLESLLPFLAFAVGLPLGVYVVRKASHII